MMQDMDFLQYLQSLPPEQADKLYQDWQGRREALDRRSVMSEQLRNTQLPQGMQVGNQYFASSPLENLASLGKQGLGMYQTNQLGKEYKALSDDYGSTLSNLAQSIFRNKQQTFDPLQRGST